MKNHQPGAAGLADGPGLAGPALGTIPRRWQHLGRPVISQRIQCEHGPCRCAMADAAPPAPDRRCAPSAKPEPYGVSPDA
jgi:hypothetical protein